MKQVPEHSAVSERLNRAVETRCKRRIESGLDSESGDHWFVAATTAELRSSLAALAREHTASRG